MSDEPFRSNECKAGHHEFVEHARTIGRVLFRCRWCGEAVRRLPTAPLSAGEIKELLGATLHGPLPQETMGRVFATLAEVDPLRLRVPALEQCIKSLLAIMDGRETEGAFVMAWVHGYRVEEAVSKRNGETIEAAYKLVGLERPKAEERSTPARQMKKQIQG